MHTGLLVGGLACVAVPIIIHLLMQRRRRPVRWGAMRFLLEAYRRQRRRMMLERWLLLALRCALVALVAAALARPMLGAGGGLLGGVAGAGGRTVYLLIDNGIASGVESGVQPGVQLGGGAGARSGERRALDRHIAAALEVLSELKGSSSGAELRDDAGGGTAAGGGDRVALIALGGPAAEIVMPPTGDVAAVERLVRGLEPTDSRTDLTGALALAKRAIAASEADRRTGSSAAEPLVVVLSDFHDGSVDVSRAGGEGRTSDSTAEESGAATGAAAPAETESRAADGRGNDRAPIVFASSPAEAAIGNIAVIGVEPLRGVLLTHRAAANDRGPTAGGEGEQVRVELRRTLAGDAGAATTVRVRLDLVGFEGGPPGAGRADAGMETDVVEGRASVRWSAGQEYATVVVPLPPLPAAPAGGRLQRGAGVLTAEIDRDALSADNQARRSVDVRDALRVGVVGPTRFSRSDRADKIDAAGWVRLALSPTAGPDGSSAGNGGDIEVIDIEPASIDVSRLAGLDGLVVPRPDLISEEAWPRVRAFAASGGCVLVLPPPGASVHLWADDFERAFQLGWSLPREAVEVADRSAESAGGTLVAGSGGEHTSGGGEFGGLLRMIRGELDELARGVKVFRALPLVEEPTGAGSAAPSVEPRETVSGEERVLMLAGAGEPGRGAESVVLWAGRTGANGSGAGIGRGGLLVYLGIALDLEWSDLPARPLMVPLLQEVLRQGIAQARSAAALTAGVRPAAESGLGGGELVRVWPRESGEAAAPSEALRSEGWRATDATLDRISLDAAGDRSAAPAIRHAGVWRSVDARGAKRGLVIVNPDTTGSTTGVQARASVGGWLLSAMGSRGTGGADRGGEGGIVWLPTGGGTVNDPSREGGVGRRDERASSVAEAFRAVLEQDDRRSPLWLPVLIAALVVAVIEMFAARRASHAEIGPLGGSVGGLGAKGTGRTGGATA